MSEMNIELGVVPEITYKVVTDPSIARKLHKDGFPISDIKPKRGRERESVFVFEATPDFMERFNLYIKEKKEKNAEKKQNNHLL